MDIHKLLKDKAKDYPKLPYEMRLVLHIVLFLLIIFNRIGEGIFYLLTFLQSRVKKTKQALFKHATQIKHKSAHKKKIILKRKKASRQFSFNLFSTFFSSSKKKQQKKKAVFSLKKNQVSQKKNHKQKHTVFTPLPFFTKAKYFLIGCFFSMVFFFFPLLAFIYIQNLPSPKELTLRQIPQTTRIYDRNGVLLDQIYASQNRTLIPLADVPTQLQQATLAIEDKNFYTHPGFDLVSILRALKENISGRSFQGGSTITQQLIKSSMLTPEPSLIRKLKEVILAFWAERIYSKKQILEMYFNQVPYGGTAWGVEAAAEIYFDKHVKDLNLAESAFLAGLTQAPSVYSPYGPHGDLWKTRQKEVLDRMVALGDISTSTEKQALAQKLVFKSPQIPQYAPHFVNYVKDLLTKKYGIATVEKGGLNVYTTIDVKKQDLAQKIVTDEVNKSAYLNLTNGAALITDPQNGDILAMVGSKDFSDPTGGNVNVTTSLRQPGSTIKVVTYSAAFTQGMTAASLIDDTPTVFQTIAGPYAPVDYDGHYYGKVPLRFALANSLNIPAVKLLAQVGIPTMVNLARDMGVKSWTQDMNQFGLSTTLGGHEVTMLDMATVFGTLAHQGARVDLNPILKITTTKGELLEEKKPTPGKQVISKAVAFIISNILADNQTRTAAFGPHSPLEIPGHIVSVKTGTTDYKRDNWTIGYTNNFVVTVWVGNNNNTPMNPVLASGITGAAPIWSRIMTALVTQKPETPPQLIDTIAQRFCNGRLEYFVKGTENQPNCTTFPPKTYSRNERQEVTREDNR